MAYHVACSPENNVVYAGTINKKGDKWVNRSEVTEECLKAARDHLANIALKEEVNELGYHWELSNGKMIVLKVVLMNEEETKEFKENLQKKDKEM